MQEYGQQSSVGHHVYDQQPAGRSSLSHPIQLAMTALVIKLACCIYQRIIRQTLDAAGGTTCYDVLSNFSQNNQPEHVGEEIRHTNNYLRSGKVKYPAEATDTYKRTHGHSAR